MELAAFPRIDDVDDPAFLRPLAPPRAKLLLLKRDVLLILRKQNGLWDLPGGKIEPDETPAEGLAREVREELGLSLPATPTDSGRWLRRRTGRPDVMIHFFTVRLEGAHADIRLSDEHVGWRWVDAAALRRHEMPDGYWRAALAALRDAGAC